MDKPVVTDQPPPYSAVVPKKRIRASAPPPPGMQPQMSGNPYPGAPPPPQAAYPTAPAGAYPPPPPGQGYVPNYGATNIIVTPPYIAVGVCPACRVGYLEDDFTCLGIACAIIFFPIGILCCLALKNKRCTNCGAYFG